MKRALIFLFVLLLHFVNGQTYFEKIFYNQHGSACAREDSIGNIIVSFPEDSTIVKFDNVMNPIWNRTYDFSTYIFEILQNGNWLGGGYKNLGVTLTAHMSMLDSNGDTVWTRMPISPSLVNNIIVNQMRVDQSGNYIFLVSANNSNHTPVQLNKMNILGDTLGVLHIGGGNAFNYNVVFPNKIVIAYSYWNPVIPSACIVQAFDSTFNFLWNSILLDTTGISHLYGAGIVLPNSSNNIVVGGNMDWYTCFFHFSANGIINSISYPLSSCFFKNVIQISNGGYLCLGSTSSNVGFAARINSGLSTIWYVEFTGINGVNPMFAQQTTNGDFIISGTTTDSSSSLIPWMIKLDQNGSTTTGVDEIKTSVGLQVNYRNNSFEITQSKGNKLIIYDMTGRIIRIVDNLSHTYSSGFSEKEGIYLFSLFRNTEFIECKKIFIYSN